MAMFQGAPGRAKAEVNVTPMIDILLVLLIIFMVINTRSTGLDAHVPQPSPEDAASSPFDVVITVQGDETVRLNQETVRLADLEGRLREVLRIRGDRVIFLGGAEDLDFARIVEVIDIARGVGLSNVALLPR